VSIFSSPLSFTVSVSSTRLVESPMFENVSVFHWVTEVEYELRIHRSHHPFSLTLTQSHSLRADEPPLCSVFKRYKELSRWLNEVRSILEVTQPLEELALLHLPSSRLLPTINTPSV
jgi:hypothetical protein